MHDVLQLELPLGETLQDPTVLRWSDIQGRDVHGVHVRALERGFRVHAAPHEFSVKGASGQLLQMTSLSLWDPDDYFIEYNQRQEAA